MRNRKLPDVNTDERALEAASVDFGRVVHKRPRGIVRPVSAREVAKFVREANREGCPVAIQGAGHSQSGHSLIDDGILIEMKGLDRIGDVEDGEISVQGGARWRDLVSRVYAQGYLPMGLTSHLSPTVGGTLSAAGIGAMAHRYGAQTDNLAELEVVTGDGRLLRCSPERNTALFDCVRCGQGQFGVLTEARLRLRRARPSARTFKLFYDDVNAYMQDLELLVNEDRFPYIQTWCLPAARSMWAVASGEFFAQRLYSLELTEEWDEIPPDPDQLLDGLRYARLASCVDSSTLSFVTRLDRTGPGIWFGDWAQSHPCTEGLLPWEAFVPFISETLTSLPGVVARNTQVLLGPLRNDRIQSPLLMRPTGRLLMGFGILVEFPESELTEALPALAEVSRRLIEKGGKRYLSGWVDFDRKDWQAHFGELWPQLLERKREFDPQGILNPGAIPW